MKSLQLSNKVSIPIVGLGTYRLEGKTCYNAVMKALSLGYRHIDTAKFYSNEEEIGKAITDSKIPRSEIFLTTKMWYSDHGYENALKAFDRSLKLLNLEYVDLYLIHWPEANAEKKNKSIRSDTWRAFEKIYKDGKAKAIGVSNYTIGHLDEMKEYAKIMPMVNQVEFHPKLYQKDLMDYCVKHEIVLTAYSSLAKGELINDKNIMKIAKKNKKSTAQILLKWAVQQNIVVIPKSSHEERMVDNFDLFSWDISEEDMKYLDSLNENYHCTWDPNTIQ
jgi:diketogulonate reductase-like aldo/keto reductase